mmetsp:Transcript_46948/g.124233  ORF Transcript_46948/g.124233 Transcript_46948/m.124233 type:complete len:213 (+) Transcript_46948:2134-2772(+)
MLLGVRSRAITPKSQHRSAASHTLRSTRKLAKIVRLGMTESRRTLGEGESKPIWAMSFSEALDVRKTGNSGHLANMVHKPISAKHSWCAARDGLIQHKRIQHVSPRTTESVASTTTQCDGNASKTPLITKRPANATPTSCSVSNSVLRWWRNERTQSETEAGLLPPHSIISSSLSFSRSSSATRAASAVFFPFIEVISRENSDCDISSCATS